MKIVLLGDYPSMQAERLRGLLGSAFEIVALESSVSETEIAKAFANAEVVVSNRYDSSLPPAPQLRLLQSPSAGLEAIDLRAVPEQALVAAALGHEIPMAEYALCAMLDHAIGFHSLRNTFDDGRFSLRHWIKGPVHHEVFGRTLGLLGYGGIARETAKRAKAFGMTVRALSRWSSGQMADENVDQAYRQDQRDAFLGDLDYLLVTLPLTSATTGYVDSDWFCAMSPQTVLINIGRGPVVEEAALYEALKSSRIGGAVLDVWYNYPSNDSESVAPSRFPFHELENAVMTPHGSGRTNGTFARRWEHIASNIRSMSDGTAPTGVVRRN